MTSLRSASSLLCHARLHLTNRSASYKCAPRPSRAVCTSISSSKAPRRSFASLRGPSEFRNTLQAPFPYSGNKHSSIGFQLVAQSDSNGVYSLAAQASESPAQSASDHASKISNEWLRDHCECPECIHPATKQRNINVLEFPPEATQIAECSIEGQNISVRWQNGHQSQYDVDWLSRALSPSPTTAHRQGYIEPTWWSASNLEGPDTEVHYESVMQTSEGLAEWTRKIRQMGFCFVADCPETPEATEALLNRIGPIRNTHYGAFWDFTSNLASKDTAYTSEGLDVHTDTNYFTDPARLQLFHLLQHSGTGGASQLVDGFRAALLLHESSPQDYATLTSQNIFFHASGNEGLSITPNKAYPVFQTDGVAGALSQVRWNNADRGAFVMDGHDAQDPHGMDKVARWYRAARAYNSYLQRHDPSLRYEFQLRPGRPLIFDNWRVLHGRSAFTGLRRMCGGYINNDDFISRYRTSNFGHEEVLRSGVY